MNKERLIALANRIENETHTRGEADSVPEGEIYFNMGPYYETAHGCGTVACIAGYACVMFSNDIRKIDEDNAHAEARKLLGLSLTQADYLFLGSTYTSDGDLVKWTDEFLSDVTPKAAATAIRELVENDGVP